jgi:NADPH-dependent 2,4-dienoyl-CoA reductase/sulfur reductase-like enzyme
MRADVLIVGAGPAGMSAAIAAANGRGRVVVLDDNPQAGGQIWRAATVGVAKRDSTRDALLAAFKASGAVMLAGRQIVDVPGPGVLRALCGEVVEDYAWDRLILATGAREKFLPFPGWTAPGVFGAGGLEALAKGGFSVQSKRVFVSGTGPLLLAVAAHLRGYGAQVVGVAEQASFGQLMPFAASLVLHPGKLIQGLRFRAALGTAAYRTGCWVVEATPSADGRGLRSVTLHDGQTVECDLLACGFHLVPNTELASLLGCQMREGLVAVDATQMTSMPGVFCAGEPTGIAGLDAALLEGSIAGYAASGDAGAAQRLQGRSAQERRFGERMGRAFRLRDELRTMARPETLVCRCEDVTFASLVPHSGWTDAKLQTRCGMGACQGRICGPAVATLFGWTPSSIRPPLAPIPLEAMIGTPSTTQQEIS